MGQGCYRDGDSYVTEAVFLILHNSKKMHHTVTDAFNEIIGYVFSIIYHCIIMCLLQKL